MNIVNNLRVQLAFLYRNPLLVGIFFIFVLPPVGVLILISLGILHIINKIKSRDVFPINIVTLFFMTIFTDSLVASIERHIWGYIHVPVMIMSYYGVYLYVYEKMKHSDYKLYRWLVIWGGIYIFVYDKIHRGLVALGIHLGYFNYLTGSVLLGYPFKNRLYGSAYNPNFAAFLLLLSLAFLLVYMLYSLRQKLYKKFWLSLPLLLIVAVGIVESGSRSAFITMFLLIGAFIARYNWKIIPVILVGFLVKFNYFYHLIPRRNLIDLSFSNRLIIWKTSLKILINNFQVGVTPVGFKSAYYSFTGKYVPHAHNIILSFFTEYGFMGGMMFVLLSLLTVVKWFQLLKSPRKTLMSDWFLFALPIILFTGLLDYPLYSPQVALPTLIMFSAFYKYSERTQFVAHFARVNYFKETKRGTSNNHF